MIDRKRNIKVDYNSNNYFYNDEEYYGNYPYQKREFYDKRSKNYKYNNETNDSYVTVEQEDGNVKYVSKKYVEFKRAHPSIYNNEEYYEENSEDDNMYYENEDEDEQDFQSPKGYNQYQGMNKYYLTQENTINNNRNNNRNNNNIKKIEHVISRPITHQVNYAKDLKRKGRTPGGNLHNVGNNTTTTNNTYNNNIYYINPINVKNKNKVKKEEINNKAKKQLTMIGFI